MDVNRVKFVIQANFRVRRGYQNIVCVAGVESTLEFGICRKMANSSIKQNVRIQHFAPFSIFNINVSP